MSESNSAPRTLTYSKAAEDLGAGFATFSKGAASLAVLTTATAARLLAKTAVGAGSAIRRAPAQVHAVSNTAHAAVATPVRRYALAAAGVAVVAAGAVSLWKLKTRKPQRPTLELVVNDGEDLSVAN